jgi:ferritin-like metal-binding protein YciE
MKNFYDFFVKELQDIYNSELQILQILPRMAQEAQSADLREAFLNHFEETREQVKRLEKIGILIKEDLRGELCKAMQGLVQEGQELLRTPFDEHTKDAALISAGQRIEHYEIAVYGCLKTYAHHLDLDEVESLLKETLKEEGAADKKLTTLAEGGLFHRGINKKALHDCCHTR